ncbi:hypothetical protein ACJIZ3_000944 [Penstemon smallii]|uniref:RNA-polymerase II-associated protein 3-like C-terminal domain-containing protein n=1 Tax=Penstemon smallii TaxID=265156 RepID=A0ABD3U3X9_9LAMI
MAKVPYKHPRDQVQEFEGLLNNLQDWELSFKEKDKKLRSDATGKDKMVPPGQTTIVNSANRTSGSTKVNGKQSVDNSSSSDTTGPVRHFNYMKDYDALNLSSGLLSEESSIDANSEKELGNEIFKKKKYNDAIDCYSRSIALSPTAVAYANRAMAFIKIRRFQEAEDDCTEALNLDDRYIKAYSRRSTARKELGKLKESIDDAEFALRLEPQNQEVKKQYAEVKSLFQKNLLKKASGALAGSMDGEKTGKSKVDKDKSVSTSSPSGKVAEILEDTSKTKVNNTREINMEPVVGNRGNNMRVDKSDADNGSETETSKRKQKNGQQELRTSVQELAAKAAKLAKAEAAKNIAPPNSAYQFEVTWRGLSGDRDLQAKLLKVTPPATLPLIFKNALTAPVLIDIIRCIATFFVQDMDLGVKYLQNLPKIPRFDMIIMCLSSADKHELVKIWNEVFSKGTADYDEILDNIRPRYGIK